MIDTSNTVGYLYITGYKLSEDKNFLEFTLRLFKYKFKLATAIGVVFNMIDDVDYTVEWMILASENEYDEYLEWLNDFEHIKLEIPAPDFVLYLNMPIEVSQKLMAKRYNGDENKKDIHEKNISFLEKCHSSAKYCADKLGWEVVDCAFNGEPRSIEEISNEVYSKVKGKV